MPSCLTVPNSRGDGDDPEVLGIFLCGGGGYLLSCFQRVTYDDEGSHGIKRAKISAMNYTKKKYFAQACCELICRVHMQLCRYHIETSRQSRQGERAGAISGSSRQTNSKEPFCSSEESRAGQGAGHKSQPFVDEFRNKSAKIIIA